MHFQRLFFYWIFMLSFYLRNVDFYVNILKYRIKLIVNNIIINKQKLISKNIYIDLAKVNII
jgi:competence CoiA-like predicted nuclease